jgi:uncharacterized protein DUF1232
VSPGPVVAIVLSLVAAWALFILVLWVFRPRDVSLGELVRLVPDVLRLVGDLLLVWIISPIDLIPEFIPVVGPLDDVVVAVLVLRFVRRRLGAETLRRRWRGTPDGWTLLTGVLGS